MNTAPPLTLKYNINLKPYNTFGMEVNARDFVEISGESEFPDQLKLIINKTISMKGILIIAIFLFGICQVFGQNLSDTIQIYNFSGTEYYFNGNKLHPRDLQQITLSNEAAWNEIIIARSRNSTATILGISGGFLLGSHLILKITGQGSIFVAGAVGTGLIVASLPFFASYRKHARKAVKIYNDGIKQKNMNKTDLSVGIGTSGIGIQMSF